MDQTKSNEIYHENLKNKFHFYEKPTLITIE